MSGMTTGPLPDPDALLAAAATDRGADATLAALGTLGAARAALDDLERRLIVQARQRGATWTQVARSLGLASRQAAEQRWLWLSGDTTRSAPKVRGDRLRQRSVDSAHGSPLSDLRAAAVELHRRLRSDGRWDSRFPRAALARMTLSAAVDAPPGSLFALVEKVILDFGQEGVGMLPRSVSAALESLRLAARRATPSGGDESLA